MMSQAWGSSCVLSAQELSTEGDSPNKVRSSCALIMKDGKILGILTERDIVKLTASAIAFADFTVAEVMTHPVVMLKEDNFPDIFAALFLFRTEFDIYLISRLYLRHFQHSLNWFESSNSNIFW